MTDLQLPSLSHPRHTLRHTSTWTSTLSLAQSPRPSPPVTSPSVPRSPCPHSGSLGTPTIDQTRNPRIQKERGQSKDTAAYPAWNSVRLCRSHWLLSKGNGHTNKQGRSQINRTLKIKTGKRSQARLVQGQAPPCHLPPPSVLTPGSPKYPPTPGGDSLPQPCWSNHTRIPLPVLTENHQAFGVHLIFSPIGSQGRAVGQQLTHQELTHDLRAQGQSLVLGDVKDKPEEAGEGSLPMQTEVKGTYSPVPTELSTQGSN